MTANQMAERIRAIEHRFFGSDYVRDMDAANAADVETIHNEEWVSDNGSVPNVNAVVIEGNEKNKGVK